MPIAFESATLHDVSVYLWNIEETTDELLSLCSNAGIDTSVVYTYRSQQRVREKLATLLLLHHIFGNRFRLEYSSVGAPRIANSSAHISISHSAHVVGVALSHRHPVGLDIEHKADQVLRVREKFLNASELQAVNPDDKTENLQYWTAKEAIYKAIEADGIDFRHHICKSAHHATSFMAVKDNVEHLFTIHSFMHDNHFMVTIAIPNE